MTVSEDTPTEKKPDTPAPAPAETTSKVAEAAARSDTKKPAGISDSEWRKARIDAGHMVIIRSHFKSIYLVPLAILSFLLAGFSNMFTEPQYQETFGLIWMCGFVFYMNIFIFEWSRSWTWGFLFTIVALVAVGFAMNSPDFPVWGGLVGWLKDMNLVFSTHALVFFGCFFAICAFISWIKTRLSYVVIENNEVQVFRNALFGDRERMPMPNSRIEVRVPDMIEYLHPFYWAGQIVIHTERQTLVLDNVLNIRRIERITDRLGSSLQVRLHTDN